MTFKRFLVEFDTGVDLHGLDATKASTRAVKGAMSHCCMCGLEELLGLTDPSAAMRIEVKIGCPFPERVDVAEIRKLIPFGAADVEAVAGGMLARGLHVPALGEGDSILLANAAVTVWIDKDQVRL